MTSNTNDAQREFDERYITSSEIAETLGVSRSTILHARRTGKLPDMIVVRGRAFIWERDKVKDYIEAWKVVLDARREAHA